MRAAFDLTAGGGSVVYFRTGDATRSAVTKTRAFHTRVAQSTAPVLETYMAIALGALAFGEWLRRRARPDIRTMRRAIVRLDLDPVRQKAAERHGWNAATAAAMESDYRDFLILIAENPKVVISPWSDALDLFWHEHILDTARYAADCRRVLGRFIQHDPHIARDPYRHDCTIEATKALRAEQLRARSKGGGSHANDGVDVATWG